MKGEKETGTDWNSVKCRERVRGQTREKGDLKPEAEARTPGAGPEARLLTWALTSTCPVPSSRLTISRFPILAAWWRQVEPSSS